MNPTFFLTPLNQKKDIKFLVSDNFLYYVYIAEREKVEKSLAVHGSSVRTVIYFLKTI